MKVSDFVARSLAERGVRDVFLVSGGGIMHLLDSVGAHPSLRYHTAFHEQAAVIAAEGYARRTGRPGVALVTVGPGAANAVAGLPGAWVDSIPLVVLAGQVRRDIIADYAVQRQYGPQEANTLDMARPVTKFALSVRDPAHVREALDLAFHHALTGRPGPVWVEFPLDVQGASVDADALRAADIPHVAADTARLRADVARVVGLLRRAERPLIVPGTGIHQARAESLLAELLRRTGIPAALAFTGKDLIAEDHPNLVGVFGTAGQRRANFAVQNSDALLTLAAGLNVQKVGFNVAGFAPRAIKAIVDVDEQQLYRQAVKPDVAVLADVRAFLEALIPALGGVHLAMSPRWTAACARWKERYPVITPECREDPDHVNSYLFMDELSNTARATDTIVAGAGLDAVSCYQAFRVKAGQRVHITGWGSMGWDLPLAIGACVGTGKQRTVVIAGDGSVQFNIQELMTISRYRLPIKVFVFNNEGFASIRGTQSAFFEDRFVGAHPESGVGNPDFAKLASAYGLGYSRIGANAQVRAGLGAFLANDEPALCEVMLAPGQGVTPKASAFRRADGTFESRPLEDMSPFLPREEVAENMGMFDEARVRS